MNPKQKEVSPLNGKVGHLYLTLHSVIPNVVKTASSVWNDYQTHVRVRNRWKKL